MSKKIRTEAVDHLFEAILCLKDKEECYTFFEDVCTINEILSLSQRFEVLLFAISRQMIVGHVSGFEVLAGVAAIAGLFATHKFLYAKSFGTEEKEEKQDK